MDLEDFGPIFGLIAVLFIMLSGLMLMFGAKRRAVQMFLLGVAIVFVPTFFDQVGIDLPGQATLPQIPNGETAVESPCFVVSPLGAEVEQGAGYFSPEYLQAEERQHLGTDFPVGAGTIVRSPAKGRILQNWTDNSDIMQAVLIVRDETNQLEHVLGHISSGLPDGTPVHVGDPVGVVRDWGRRSHLHWGVNRASVVQAIGIKQALNWGWGRAPATVTQEDAAALGWMDLNEFLVTQC